jgi:hypothetical protein
MPATRPSLTSQRHLPLHSPGPSHSRVRVCMSLRMDAPHCDASAGCGPHAEGGASGGVEPTYQRVHALLGKDGAEDGGGRESQQRGGHHVAAAAHRRCRPSPPPRPPSLRLSARRCIMSMRAVVRVELRWSVPPPSSPVSRREDESEGGGGSPGCPRHQRTPKRRRIPGQRRIWERMDSCMHARASRRGLRASCSAANPKSGCCARGGHGGVGVSVSRGERRKREIIARDRSIAQRGGRVRGVGAGASSRWLHGGGTAAEVVSGAHALMSSVLDRLQPCARPTTENGSQCVGSNECSRLTELMPSSAASPSIMVAWPACRRDALYVRSLLQSL